MKKIKNKTIRFQSIPVNWHKENLNLKRRPIRNRAPKETNDERFNILDRWITGTIEGLTVEIENTETGKYFSRKVLDVTLWDLNYIISW